MTHTLLRIAFLLFALSFVSFVGLNASPNPAKVSKAYASHVEITLSGGGPGLLDFSVGSSGCPELLVGGDTCTVLVTVGINSEVEVTLNAPTVTDGGTLDTCTGDEPDLSGGGGNNLSTTVGNLSYTPNSTELDDGDSATFVITLLVAADLPNACQGKTGTINVSVTATGDPPAPTRTPTRTPAAVGNNDNSGDDSPPIQPTSQVAGTRATPQPSPTRVNSTPVPQATFISEVLPSRFPSTGGGPLGSESVEDAAQLLMIATAMLGFGLLILAFNLRSREQKGGDR